MRHTLHPRHSLPAAGFTLIEVLVALGIVTATMLGLLSAFPYALKVNRTAANQTRAAYAAQAQMEYMVSQAYDTIPVGTVEPPARLASSTDDYLYPFSRETQVNYVDENLAPAASDTGLKRIDVTVTWMDPFNANVGSSYTLTTLVSER